MNAEVLDSKQEKNAICYLCRINLKEYIQGLPEDYRDYEVQREIVSNIYLDELVKTVLHKLHIPTIVLIAERYERKGETLLIDKFKILDGLQRTYRLNLIWKTLQLFKEQLILSNEFLDYSKLSLSRKYSDSLQKIDSNTKVFQNVIDFYKANINDDFDIIDGFTKNYQWFEIWTELDPEDEVNKMLVLNAGHKPVKIKHQLELIFRNLLPRFTEIGISEFMIKREKESSSIQFSKKRSIGEFHFSHLISSLLSIKEGKSVTTNSSLIQKLQSTDFDSAYDSELFSFAFLSDFVLFLVEADKKIFATYKDEGMKWFGREVTLVGIFGALGAFSFSNKLHFKESLKKLKSALLNNIGALNISDFEMMRNNVDLGKVNIGNVNKNAIYEGTLSLLNQPTIKKIDWKKHF